ncbi:MAG: deoxyribose-phosphate aldolase [bacterium]
MIEQIRKKIDELSFELEVEQVKRDKLKDAVIQSYSFPQVDKKMALGAIDHTILSFNAAERDVEKVCFEVDKYKFKAICVNPVWVKKVFEIRKKTNHHFLIASVVDFPLGASTLNARISETKQAVEDGADEIDIVMNIGLLKSGMKKEVYENLKKVIEEVKSYYKVILETSELSFEEKIEGALIALFAGANMLKTSTGVNGKATVEDVKLLRMLAGEKIGVKAAGGIRDKASLIEMMRAGADRVGCSSSVKIADSW